MRRKTAKPKGRRTQSPHSTLDECLEVLGPFGNLTREEATATIGRIAVEYRERCAERRPTIRRSAVRKQLSSIERTATEAARAIQQAHWFTRQILLGYTWESVAIERARELEARRELLDLDKLPERLKLLAEMAKAVPTQVLSDAGGGRGTDLHSRTFGTPEWHLAREAVDLFERNKRKATSTLHGPLHEFTEALLAHVSGERVSAAEGMIAPLRDVLRRRRKASHRR